jgi:hypothetical protein
VLLLPKHAHKGLVALDIIQRQCHVRFSPDSGHSSVQVGCLKSANSGHSIERSSSLERHV